MPTGGAGEQNCSYSDLSCSFSVVSTIESFQICLCKWFSYYIKKEVSAFNDVRTLNLIYWTEKAFNVTIKQFDETVIGLKNETNNLIFEIFFRSESRPSFPRLRPSNHTNGQWTQWPGNKSTKIEIKFKTFFSITWNPQITKKAVFKPIKGSILFLQCLHDLFMRIITKEDEFIS